MGMDKIIAMACFVGAGICVLFALFAVINLILWGM